MEITKRDRSKRISTRIGEKMENINEQIEKFISNFADEAIEKSETYSEAILYVDKHSSLTEFGQVVKKAIQEKIRDIALNSRIIK